MTMLLNPGLSTGYSGLPLHLPKLLAWYDPILSKPNVQPDGKIDKLHDISGNGHHLKVRTEVNRVHPTYDQNVFGSMPGIGNSLQDQFVELQGDMNVNSFLKEQQTWFLVYKAYRLTSRRMMAFYDNYHTPLDHPLGLAWGRNQDGNFPRTNIALLPGAICTFMFKSKTELVIRGNGVQALNSSGQPFNIDPMDHYYSGANAKKITLFTGYNIYAVEGAFGAVIFCMELLNMQLIEKVERYLSKRFGIPLVL